MAKVLVTGATGFIGPHLIRQLLAAGHDVTCLRRQSSHVESLKSLDVRFVVGDINQPESLPSAVRGAEAIYHLAGLIMALRREEFFRANEQGTRNLVQAAAAQETPPCLVLVSSLAAGGPQVGDQLRTESDPPAPVSNYGRSKLAAERAAAEFADRLPLTIARPPIVFGPADRMTLEIFKPIWRFGVHMVPGYRAKRFSFIHVDDLCRGLLVAAERGQRVGASDANAATGGGATESGVGRYYFAHGEHPTYADFGRSIGRALGRRRTLCIPTAIWFMRLIALGAESVGRVRGRPAALSLDKAREAAAGSWTCSPEKAQRELGWQCAFDLDTRLAQTTEWYRENRWL